MLEFDGDANAIKEIVSRRGDDFVRSILMDFKSFDGVLTIISNKGVHPIPKDYIFGDLYIASEGMLDFSCVNNVNKEIDNIILNLKIKLLERKWNKIYLIPFGHSVVSMNIKMAIFRILRIETVDIFYFGNGEYGLIERNNRELISR